jgi:outer membrane receptor protein involved in Fe transport
MRRLNSLIFSTVSIAALTATPALGQVNPADQPPPQTMQSEQEAESGTDANQETNPSPATNQEIVVTGSRIRRPNLESPLPVTSVGGQEFFQTGNVSIGDKLAELPSIASTFTQANSTRGLGTAGLNLLDLRGLGTARTLVLVNGRRHVGGDVLSSGVSPDVNTIPTDLIERVDVVTGGNSAVYGSDAIAGVVNFVLKQDYDGVLLRGQGGQSKYGDANAYFISGLVGKNFAGGRGNVAVNVEYARRDQAFGNDRRWFYEVLAVNDQDAAGTPNGSDGIPDRILNTDFRSRSFSNTGTIQFSTGQCGVGTNGTPYTCPFIFLPNGNLVPQTGQRIGIGPGGQFVGGNGEDFANGRQVQVLPQLDRYNVNLIGHFEISPALVPFVEAKYSRTESEGTGNSGPAFVGGGFALGDFMSFLGFRNRERVYLDNPYLNDQARATLCQQRMLLGSTTCPGSASFLIQQNIPLPSRTELATRDTYRIVAGLRGDIGGSWNYEISGNYGQLKEKTEIKGNLNTQRALLALDAVKDPTTGQIVCRSQIDPSAAYGGTTYFYSYYYGDDGIHNFDPQFEARLAADVAACVPANFFGGNQLSQAQQDYLLSDTTSTGKTSQVNLTAFVSGDSSGLFELPGGPIGVVLGVEYREDNLAYDQDPLVQAGYTFYNPLPTFKAPKSTVKEAFGEIRLPLLKDMPFADQLEVAAAARVSDYKLGKTGTVWAWNVNALWAPVEGLRLRGNLARAVRAPNQVELFTPFGQNFALVNDPCDAAFVGAGSATRQANCIAAGVPAGTRIQYQSSLPFKNGGFTGLEAETSRSLTLGGVLTPRIIPGFSFSADYYKIKVKKAIQQLSAQFVLDQCYDSPTLNNVYCSFFQRAAPGDVGHDGLPNGIIDNSLRVSPFNFAALRARGFDIEAAYRRSLGSFGRVETRLTYTHVLELTQFTDPVDPTFGDRLLSELGNPKDAFNWNTSLQHGRFTFGYQMRYLSRMVTNRYEDFFEFQGRPPQDADYAERAFYPSRFYHDLRFNADVGKKYNFYMGVDNLTNEQPPFGTTGLTAGSGIYDPIGRFMYAGFSAKF